MVKYEFKKFPLVAVIFCIVTLLAAAVSISVSLISSRYYDGIALLALFEIVAAVLVLAGLTTGRVGLVRVIAVIITICLVIASFILSVAKFSEKDVFLFCIALLMLICSILELVYFLSLKNERIQQMHFFASIANSILIVLYTIAYVGFDLASNVGSSYAIHPHVYALLIAFACVSLLPVLVHRSLSKIEAKQPEELN